MTPTPIEIQRTRALGFRLRPEVQPRRDEGEADHAAKRQHAEHVAAAGKDDLGEDVGQAERHAGEDAGQRGTMMREAGEDEFI